MPSPYSALIVIPARYGSTRLPGKPLIPIAGHTLLERVSAVAHTAARLAGECEVIVATDDRRIVEHAAQIGVKAVITAADLDSGSDRACAAARLHASQPEFVINLQGDAPFVAPEVVAGLLTALRGGSADVATPVYRLDWDRLDRLRTHKQSTPFSGTTCIRGSHGQALWFSKSIVPAIRDEAGLRRDAAHSPVWQHIGLYGYRRAALEWFANAPPGNYERIEGLEQLRFLESGRIITTVEVAAPTHSMSGIDTPADLALAEDAIARLGDPFSA